MKFPFFCLPFTRSRFISRFSAVAFSIFVLLGSVNARALTQSEAQQAFLDALLDFTLFSSGYQGVVLSQPLWDTENFIYIGELLQWYDQTVGESSYRIQRLLSGADASFYQYLRSLSSTGQVEELLSYVEDWPFSFVNGRLGDDLLVRDLYLQDAFDEMIDDFEAYGNAVFAHQVRMDNDMRDVLEYLANGFSVTVDGGEIYIDGTIDANVLNWPEYYTGAYDEDVRNALLEGSDVHLTEWNSDLSDLSDSAQEAEDDVDSSVYIYEVSNEVSEVHFDDSLIDSSINVRNEIFDPINDQLLPQSAVSRTFSTDILLTTGNSAFGIPRLEWSASSSGIDQYLVSMGTFMGHVYDVLFAVFLMWLIWREYHFYFVTMAS